MYIIYQALYQKTFYFSYLKMFFVPGKLFQVSVITSSKAGAYTNLVPSRCSALAQAPGTVFTTLHILRNL